MSGYNTPEDDNNDSPLLIRIPNSGDAAAVDRAVGARLAELTPEQQAAMPIPTPTEVSRGGLIGDVKESLSGTPQDQIELSRLSDDLGVLKARVVKIRATGSMVPRQLENEVIAKENSLNYQADRMRASTPDPAVAEAEADNALLLSAYKTDMQSAVRSMMKSERVTRDTALGLVEKQIAAFGAAKVLPQFGRIEARMAIKYPQSDA